LSPDPTGATVPLNKDTSERAFIRKKGKVIKKTGSNVMGEETVWEAADEWRILEVEQYEEVGQTWKLRTGTRDVSIS
jgi:hypothetical protein